MNAVAPILRALLVLVVFGLFVWTVYPGAPERKPAPDDGGDKLIEALNRAQLSHTRMQDAMHALWPLLTTPEQKELILRMSQASQDTGAKMAAAIDARRADK